MESAANITQSDTERTGACVLVCEDDAGLNRLICRSLAASGIAAHGVYSGYESLSRLSENRFELLLLDYMLPDMNGSAIVESMRAEAIDIPFVIMTGHGDQRVAVEMMKLGAKEYLVKDANFIEQLPKAVTRVLGRIETERRLEQARAEKITLEQQLRQAQKMEAVGVLAGGVAHDFNNLLTAIHGYTSLALRELDTGSKLYDQLATVQDCAERASSLTRQLLLFSRNEPSVVSPVNLNRIITDMLKMIGRLIGEDVRIVTEPAADIPHVNADPGTMEQVVMNLAVNARDAMPGGGVLTFSTRAATVGDAGIVGFPEATAGEYVCMSVADTGCGMSPETRERIFEPFFTTKDAGTGTGLGLAVVYGILRQHGGFIQVDSTLGEGTRFDVYLPASTDAFEQEGVDDRSLGALQGSGEGVLVVEDDDVMREWCAIALRENGYRVYEAADAATGIAVFEQHAHDIALVISDVIMPDKSGLQLADEIKVLRPTARFIMMSGYTGSRSRTDLIRELGYDFLQKPYTIVDLLRAAKACLENGASGVSGWKTAPVLNKSGDNE